LGMGFYSTPFLIDHCYGVLSIEQQDKDWFRKVYDVYYLQRNWQPIFNTNPFYISDINIDIYKFALIDGVGAARACSVLYLMQKKMDTILAHDSENGWYGYATLDQPAKDLGYFDYAFEEYHPQSRLFTRNKKLITAIHKNVYAHT